VKNGNFSYSTEWILDAAIEGTPSEYSPIFTMKTQSDDGKKFIDMFNQFNACVNVTDRQTELPRFI